MKIKRKGAYAYVRPDEPNSELGWYSNHSALIVPKAAEQALIYDEDIEYFIKNHKDIYDFMLRTKVPRSSKLVIVDDLGNENQTQNICRYYICKKGDGELLKIMPPLDKIVYGQKWTKDDEEVIITTKIEEEKYTKKGFTYFETVELPKVERRIGINAGWKVRVCNNIKNYIGEINYDFYIEEAKKLVDKLVLVD